MNGRCWSDEDLAALHRLVEKYAAIKEKHESVVILGSDYTETTSPTELTFNARVAANLNVPVVLVVSGRNRSPEAVRSAAEGGLAEFEAPALDPGVHKSLRDFVARKKADAPDAWH